MVTAVNSKNRLYHPASAINSARAPVHDLCRLLCGLPAFEIGVRFVKDDLQNFLIATGTAVGVLQYVHQIIGGGLVKQKRKIACLADLNAALFADGRLLFGPLRFDLLLHQLAQRGAVDRERVCNGLLKVFPQHVPQRLRRRFPHGGTGADTKLQNRLICRPAVRIEGKHTERAAGLLVPGNLHGPVHRGGVHRLLHDAVRGGHCGRNGCAGRQNIQKFLALEGGGLCIIVQILLRRVAAVDAEQILTAPEKADVRNCAAQHVLDRRFQRRAELLRRAEQRVERKGPDDGIKLPVHITRLQNTGQKLRFRHPVQRQQNAVFRVARVLRAAQIAAIKQIGTFPASSSVVMRVTASARLSAPSA